MFSRLLAGCNHDHAPPVDEQAAKLIADYAKFLADEGIEKPITLGLGQYIAPIPPDTHLANSWLRFIKEIQHWGNRPGYWKARSLTTDALKALWDSYDGIETSDPEIGGEEIHCLLNARGEGSYCAV